MATERLDAAPRHAAGRWPGRRLPGAAAWVAAATLASLAVAVWWVLSDHQVPSWDPAAHMFRSLQYADAFRRGDLTEWFTSYQTPGYPPLVYLLGAFATLVFGEGVPQFVIAEVAVFLPLLALGTYRAARLAYGARAGAWAAVFVLGSPLIVAQSHVFMLDLPQTAMVAVAIWLVLASRRFERGGVALAAGLACGLGMLTKNIFVLMVGGLVVVAVLRGGWRRPKGLGLFVLGVAVTGLPWYVAHFDGLLSYALGGSVSGESSVYGADPGRWSPDDWLWYLWAALNVQLYLPLWLFGAAGTAWGIGRIARRRPWAPDDVTPELLGGLLAAIVLCVALTHNDVRYTMPLVVYVGILGTAWFATGGRRWLRVAAGALLAAVCALNLFTASTGEGPDAGLRVPGTWTPAVTDAGRATVFSTGGWLVAGPQDGGRVQDALAAARRQGARLVAIDRVGAGASDFNAAAIGVLARFAGLRVAPGDDYAALGPRDLFVTSGASPAPPCGRTPSGVGIYYERGSDLQPIRSADDLVCPPRSPAAYASPAPVRPDAAARAQLLAELRAARRQGATSVYFRETMATSGLYGGAHALQALGRRAGLAPPPGNLASNVGPEGVTALVMADYPAVEAMACHRLPDGDALVLLRGPVRTLTLNYATNLYCPTRSPRTFTGPGGG